jgi:molybdopterin synthase catalytic subunit
MYNILGITRNNFNGLSVNTLYYECYEEMALKEMKRLAE